MAAGKQQAMIRTFLAVELPEGLRTRLARLQQQLRRRLRPERDCAQQVRIAWVAPAALHLTIRFLGDTDAALVEPLRDAIRPLLAAHGRLYLPLERLGVFPDPLQPRVLWVGPSAAWADSAAARALASLQRAVEARCRALGMAPDEQPWRPHITLARTRQGESQLAAALAGSGVLQRPLAAGALAIDAIVLMRSELRPGGSVYMPLWQAALAGGERRNARES